jgi:acyl-CoA thioesterase-1
LLVLGCQGQRNPPAASGDTTSVPSAPSAAPAAPAVPASPASPASSAPSIVFLGTSLTAGLGLDPDQAYPALIQQKVDSLGLHYRIVNAGVSGESSAGALRRIDWLLREPPAVLIIETGANDMLRGQDVDSVRRNIQEIIDRTRARSAGTKIVLVGMEALPNLGADYARRFHEIYPELARANQIPLVPFLLTGVAGVDSLNQQDGIHPTIQGQRIVADNLWPALAVVLQISSRPEHAE